MAYKLNKKYVDGMLAIVLKLDSGYRWEEGKLERREEWILEDEEQGKSRSKVTVDAMVGMANSIKGYLKFTADYSETIEPIAVLDTQIWVGRADADGEWFQKEEVDSEKIPGENQTQKENTILYKFYKKSMSSPFTIINRSAIPEATKVATANGEIIRRFKRTSTQLGRGEFERILLEFTGDL